jgi:translin
MSKLTEQLEAIAGRIREEFSVRDAVRERTLSSCREVIRLSATAIRAVHRWEYGPARKLLKQARGVLEGIDEGSPGTPRSGGYVHDAQKEFVEGCVTLALVTGEALPEPEGLGVSSAAYLNGLGEAVGELRRYLLDAIRRGDLAPGEELLAAMDDIYGVLVTMDFPDAITGGLRRTTDAVRGILERTRGDITLASEQRGLERKLEALEEKLNQRSL